MKTKTQTQTTTTQESTTNSTEKQLVAAVIDRMPMRKTCKTTKEVVTAYNDSIELLHLYHAQMLQFIWDAVTANIQIYSHSKNVDLLHKGLNLFHVPKWIHEDPNILDWEVTAKPTGELYSLCNETIENEVTSLVKQLFEVLNQMVEMNYFGLWQVHDENSTSAMYYFFRCVVSQSHVRDRYETYFQRRETESAYAGEWWKHTKHHKVFNEKIVYERHEHHLYDMNVRDIDFRMKKPGFIQQLLKRVPDILRPFVKIVEGEMSKEEIKVSKICDQTFEKEGIEIAEFAAFIAHIRLGSPAVVIDRYVVSGWADRDLR